MRINGHEHQFSGLTEDRRGVLARGTIFWTFPVFQKQQNKAYVEAVEILLPYAPVEIKAITWDYPDLTVRHPETVRNAYEKQQRYHREVTYEQHLKNYGKDEWISRDQFETARTNILAQTLEQFRSSLHARHEVWEAHGTDDIAEEFGYQPFTMWCIIREGYRKLGYSEENAAHKLQELTHVVLYDDPDLTTICLKGVKEEIDPEWTNHVPIPVATLDATSQSAKEATSSVAQHVFQKSGSVWKVVYDGDSFHLEDTLGAKYLDYLLHHPNEPIHAFELEIAIEPERAKIRMKDSIQEGLDPQTVSEYMRRLNKLQAERDRAEHNAMPMELHYIDIEVQELQTALHENQAMSDAGERARGNVSKAIAAVKKKLLKGDKYQKTFGKHIDELLTTGYECMYAQPLGRIWQ